jgi:hypothetical protein
VGYGESDAPGRRGDQRNLPLDPEVHPPNPSEVRVG